MPAKDQQETEYSVINGYLVERADGCTCAGGTIESSYAHESGCGWEPIAKIEDLLAGPLVSAEHVDALALKIWNRARMAIQQLPQLDWSKADPLQRLYWISVAQKDLQECNVRVEEE